MNVFNAAVYKHLLRARKWPRIVLRTLEVSKMVKRFSLEMILIFSIYCRIIEAHYNLKDPFPYNPIDCNPPECLGPCPSVWKSGHGKLRNSPSSPSRTWHRGQNVTIEWQRNNHEGGFYRRSLVPVQYMNSDYWHEKTAFEFGCWSQGRFSCGKSGELEPCGTDYHGLAYRNNMTVPFVFPDGDYVFAMVWYGGLHWRLTKANFANYFTCAFVRIEGGPLKIEHYPSFNSGRSNADNVPGKCLTSSTFIGECGGVKCKRNEVQYSLPREFLAGKFPLPLSLNNLTEAMYNTSVFHLKYDDDYGNNDLRPTTSSFESESTPFKRKICDMYCERLYRSKHIH